MANAAIDVEMVEFVARIPRSALRVVDPPQSRWMQARTSPLGMAKIHRLVKDGTLHGSKPEGCKYLLIDRFEHDEWIARHPVMARPEPSQDDADLAAAFRVEPRR